jgi:hypothetical protein
MVMCKGTDNDRITRMNPVVMGCSTYSSREIYPEGHGKNGSRFGGPEKKLKGCHDFLDTL